MLNEALRAVRKFHQTSVQDTAAGIGVSSSYISEIENGKKRIHQDVLEGYSKLFNMPISSFYLISETVHKRPDSQNGKIKRKIGRIIQWIAED